MYWIDVVTTGIFIAEALLKMIAFGVLLNGPWSYLCIVWNIMDFTIAVISVISLTPLISNLNSIKMLRIFRALRVITKNDGLKVALGALFQAIPNVLNVTIIMLLCFSIFGIVCVSYFKGKGYQCKNQIDSVKDKWDCLNHGGQW